MKTLKKFLKEHKACRDGFEFAKDLTLEQFLNTCDRGGWILWLFQKTNPTSLQKITLAKGHCANTVRHFMKDERSLKAVDVAIAFGEGKATRKELDNAAASAADAAACAADASYASADASYASYASYASAAADASYASYASAVADAAADASYAAAADAAACAADASYASAADAADASYAATYKENQKLTADICRKYLPLEIWDQSKI